MNVHPGHQPSVSAVGLQGVVADESERMIIVGMETPMPLWTPESRLDKEIVERLHLERYRSDYLMATGRLPFDDVRRGKDPPDFVVEAAAGQEGVECTAFTLEQRRSAYRMFARLRTLLADRGEESFPNLRDTAVMVWFGLGSGLPPKRGDRDLVDALVKCMQEARIDRDRLAEVADQIAREGFPQEFPEGGAAIYWTPGKEAGFQVVPIAPSGLVGPFAKEMSFACELSMSTQVNESAVRTELERLIRQHDQEGIDHLLITLGGPDQDGLVYPAEEQLVALFADNVLQSPPVKHLKRVSSHAFRSGGICEFTVTSSPTA